MHLGKGQRGDTDLTLVRDGVGWPTHLLKIGASGSCWKYKLDKKQTERAQWKNQLNLTLLKLAEVPSANGSNTGGWCGVQGGGCE